MGAPDVWGDLIKGSTVMSATDLRRYSGGDN